MRISEKSKIYNFDLFVAFLSDFCSYYSRSSYRAPSLNTYHRCQEILRVVAEVKAGGLREGSSSSLIEELIWFGKTDGVIKEKFSKEWGELEDSLKGEEYHDNRVFYIQRFMYALDGGYFKSVKHLIEKIIVKKSVCDCRTSEKNSISKKMLNLAGIFYSYVINEGHRQEYIFFEINNFFKITPICYRADYLMHMFFRKFHCRKSNFDVYVTVNKDLNLFLREWDVENITCNVPNEIYKNNKSKLNPRGLNGQVFKFSNIEAFDYVGAREKVDHELNYTRAVNYTLRPDSIAEWQRDMVVVEEGGDSCFPVNCPISPIRSRRRISSLYSKQLIERRFKILEGDQVNSEIGEVIKNSILEFSNAFHSESSSTQLVSVWSALEGLIPNLPEGKARVDELCKIVELCEGAVYFRNLLKWSFSGHREVDPQRLSSLLENVVGTTSNLAKFAAILFDEKYKKESQQLKDIVALSPSVEYRTFEFLEKVRGRKEIDLSISNHKKKVGLHLRRIYLDRNRIVHRASPGSAVSSLILNLSEYYLSCLDVIFDGLEVSPKKDIFYILKALEVEEKSRMEAIKNSGSNRINYSVVFGEHHLDYAFKKACEQIFFYG